MVINMRDPKRIDEITAKLNELWHKYPDLRFWQLLSCISVSPKIPFYLEDELTIEIFERLIKEGL